MDELKERILSESGELFMTVGCKSITMDDIANSLGVSKRTIYEIFKDKEDLLEQAITYKLEKGFEQNKQTIDDVSHNVIESVLQMCYSTSEVVLRMHMNFIAEMQKFYPKVYQDTFLRLRDSHMNYYKDIMQKGIEQGVIGEDVSPLLVTQIIDDLHELLGKSRLHPYNLFSMRELFYHTIIKYMRGVATLKGIQIIDDYFKNPEVSLRN